ncbi:hypothetical protein ACEPAH_7400 [Sanghuangporus vaninii]
MVLRRISLTMPQSQPASYSLEVVRVEGIHRESKKWRLIVEIEFDKIVHRTGEINKDGKPASDAALIFSQSGSCSVFNISVKQSRGNSQDRLLGCGSNRRDRGHSCADPSSIFLVVESNFGSVQGRYSSIQSGCQVSRYG